MSKYIKLEDALKAVCDNTMPLDCWHIDRMRAIVDLPTIEVSEDCSDYYKGYCARYEDGCFHQCKDAPSVVPKPKEGKRSRCIWCDSPYRIEYNWIDREGNTASFADEDRHLVATGIANYCPNCGAKMKGKEKIKE